ncbi:MAG TPA: hypothetical protein VGF99_15540 [Myxococcota bacterium]
MNHVLRAAVVGACVVAAGCGGSGARQEWTNDFVTDGEDAFLVDDDFVCLDDARFDVVGHSRIWNVLGHQQQAVDFATGGDIGTYPVGTVLQLFPGEASVKRGKGFSPATGDWEFFLLDTESGETVIRERGTTEISNVGGTCLKCHGGANAYDYACFSNDGCGDLPFFIDTNVVPAEDDARCR